MFGGLPEYSHAVTLAARHSGSPIHIHPKRASRAQVAHRVRRERSRVGDQRSCNSRGELRIIPHRRTRRASTARSPVHVEAVIAAEGVLHRGARLLRGPEAHQAKPLHSARSPSRWRRSPSASGSGESRSVSSCSKQAFSFRFMHAASATVEKLPLMVLASLFYVVLMTVYDLLISVF